MEGRVALVTGAARGQGLAIVRRLRRDGIKVLAGDVLADELASAVGAGRDPEVRAVELDVTSEDGWARAVQLAEREFGGLNRGGRALRPGRSRVPCFTAVDALDAQIYDSGINFDYGMYPAIST